MKKWDWIIRSKVYPTISDSLCHRLYRGPRMIDVHACLAVATTDLWEKFTRRELDSNEGQTILFLGLTSHKQKRMDCYLGK